MTEEETVFEHLKFSSKSYHTFLDIGPKLRTYVAKEQGFDSLKSLTQPPPENFLLSQIPATTERQKAVEKDIRAMLELIYKYNQQLGYDVTRPLLTTLHLKAFSITPQIQSVYSLYQERRWEKLAISFDMLWGQALVLDVTMIPPVSSVDEIEHNFLELMSGFNVHIRDQEAKLAADTYSLYLTLLRQDETGIAAVTANIDEITTLAAESGFLIPELVRSGAYFSRDLYQIRYPLTQGIAPEWGNDLNQ